MISSVSSGISYLARCVYTRVLFAGRDFITGVASRRIGSLSSALVYANTRMTPRPRQPPLPPSLPPVYTSSSPDCRGLSPSLARRQTIRRSKQLMQPALITPTAGFGQRLRMAVQIKQFIYTHAIKSDACAHVDRTRPRRVSRRND